jgi:hypothetical protein
MASLALLVCLIFLSILISGPLSIIFCHLGLFWLTIFASLFAIAGGAHWCCIAPFPVSMIGLVSGLCGLYSIIKIN